MIPRVEWNEFDADLGKTAIAAITGKVWSRKTGFAPAEVTCRVEPNPGGSQPIRVFLEIDWLHPSERELIVETGSDFEQLKNHAHVLLIRALTNDEDAALLLRSSATRLVEFNSRSERYQAIEPGRFFLGKKNGWVRKVVSFLDDDSLLWCDHIGAMVCSRAHLAEWSAAQVIEPEQMAEIERAWRAYQEKQRNLLIQAGAIAMREHNLRAREQYEPPFFR